MNAFSAVVSVSASAIACLAVLMIIDQQKVDKRLDGYRENKPEPETQRSLSKNPSIRISLRKTSGETLQSDEKETKEGALTEKETQNEAIVSLKSPTYLDLDGSWTISNQNRSVTVVGLVPGNVHTALQSAGLIDDPYYRFNDLAYRWIAHDSWTYSRSFIVKDASLLTKAAARLICRGLDTVANVTLNGVTVGNSDNQFIEYVFDVTGLLHVGENRIEVRFQSAVEYAQRAFDPYQSLVPPSCPPPEYNPECHANFIRKAQCSFAWDWGPAFPTQGIWKTIGIELFDDVVVRTISPHPFRDDNGWNLNISLAFDLAGSEESISGRLTLAIAELSTQFETILTLSPDNSSVRVVLPVGEADEWWPRGYGNATLYDLNVTFTPSVSREVVAVSTAVRTGFRTIELIEEPVENGMTFYFKINGVPIFMKGSNWIPMDSFYDRVNYSRLRHLLESAVDANMNSIRIWGGGVYESDDFYDVTDELGILVWQDMMFACSMYPVHDQFLSSVGDEIRYQVIRLGRHPSLVAWSANNENEGALVDNWYGTSGQNYSLYKSDYVKLYIDVVRATILEEDTSRPFLPSSPTNGQLTQQSDWISESPRPGTPEYGDVHYYNYLDDCLDLSTYPRARYSSEYGFQSWPSYDTLLGIADPVEDLVYGSEFFHHREHHHGALSGTEQVIRRYFNWPETGDKYKDFQSYIYLTQVAQAICYQAQSEFYRRSRSDPSVVTMGALYWQHNDIWQAPSWSTIDYDGQWKMAHYFAAKFFADPMLSIVEEENNLVAIFAVNDHLTSILDVHLVVQMRMWNNFSALKEWTSAIDVPCEASHKVFGRLKSELMLESSCPSDESCFLIAFLSNGTHQLTASAAYYFSPWKSAEGMLNPNVQVADVEMLDEAGSVFGVTLTASAVSAFTWLEAIDIPGRFSDNGILLIEPTFRLEFYSLQSDVDADVFRSSITITTLFGIYVADE